MIYFNRKPANITTYNESMRVSTKSTGPLLIGGFKTGALVDVAAGMERGPGLIGSLTIEDEGAQAEFLFINGYKTNIAVSAAGAVCTSLINAIDHVAFIGSKKSNIPLDAAGRLCIEVAGDKAGQPMHAGSYGCGFNLNSGGRIPTTEKMSGVLYEWNAGSIWDHYKNFTPAALVDVPGYGRALEFDGIQTFIEADELRKVRDHLLAGNNLSVYVNLRTKIVPTGILNTAQFGISTGRKSSTTGYCLLRSVWQVSSLSSKLGVIINSKSTVCNVVTADNTNYKYGYTILAALPAQTIRQFLDGSFTNQAIVADAAIPADHDFNLIGCGVNAGNDNKAVFFDGYIKSILIFDRNLSDAEMIALQTDGVF